MTRFVDYVTTSPLPINQADLSHSRLSFPLLPSRPPYFSFLRLPIFLHHAIWRRRCRDLQKSVFPLNPSLRYHNLTPQPNPGLIRHGKAHPGQKQDKPDADFAPLEHQQPHQQQRQHRAAPPKERDHPDPHHEPKEHKKAADYSREAEMIVKEERQAKNNIPQYKGLERYRILEKMGESVALSRHS